MWWGKGGFLKNLYNEQGFHQCKSLFCYPPTGLDITVLHILCLLLFPSIFPKLYNRHICTTSQLRDQAISHSVYSARGLCLGVSLGTALPVRDREAFWPTSDLTALASASPEGEERRLTFHSHRTNFAQWVFRKVYTDQEDR